ncbi:hypothetical protein [Sphingomonas soli]|uniref:hypothetical protein n=1 Tax=Sphingomonas soli TaxID=266127 RepID=UPI00082B4CD0|nr:hypothetical protein [Sphingomonas soli]
MIRFAMLLAPLALAACNGGTSISLTGNSDSGEGNVSIKTGPDGGVSIEAPGVSINTRLPKINLTSEDFDVNGLKLYPNSSIRELNAVGNDKIGEKKNSHVTVAFDAPAPLATVQAWFRDNLAKQGFKVEPQGNGFSGTTKDGDPFTLELTADGEDKAKGKIQVKG